MNTQVGFTGTQQGMTPPQHNAVASLLDVLCRDGGHVHHGDCVGADAQFHDLARDRGFRVEVHPPKNMSKRAMCDPDILWPAYEYLERNQHIVDCVGTLIAAPKEHSEVMRSGTWATVRRARKKGISVFIVYPDGRIRE